MRWADYSNGYSFLPYVGYITIAMVMELSFISFTVGMLMIGCRMTSLNSNMLFWEV